MISLKKILVGSFLLTVFVYPQIALAEDPYYGLDQTAGQVPGLREAPEAPTIIGNVIANALTLIAVLFFGLMVYGGFLWMTAHGDSGQVDKAKETIIAAIIGMIVVLASYAITTLVLNAPTGGTAPAPGSGAPASTP